MLANGRGITNLVIAVVTIAAGVLMQDARPGQALGEPRPDEPPLTAEKDKGARTPFDVERKRFVDEVREVMFAGFRGDVNSLEKAMRMCDAALKEDPKNVDAMVWHGCGLVFQARQAFRRGDTKVGSQLWTDGLAEVDRAVELEPERPSVRIARAALLTSVSRFNPDPEESAWLLKKGVADYEKVRELQKLYFNTLSVHARGELYGGLAEGWYRLNDLDKVKAYHERMVRELPGSEYARRAQAWLDNPTPRGKYKPITCIGCHR